MPRPDTTNTPSTPGTANRYAEYGPPPTSRNPRGRRPRPSRQDSDSTGRMSYAWYGPPGGSRTPRETPPTSRTGRDDVTDTYPKPATKRQNDDSDPEADLNRRRRRVAFAPTESPEPEEPPIVPTVTVWGPPAVDSPRKLNENRRRPAIQCKTEATLSPDPPPPPLEASPLRVDRSGLVASTPLPPSPISPLVVNHEVYSTYPGLDPEWKAFLAADADQSGFIDATELQTALVNIPWNRPFDPKTVNMLINMFDLDHNEVISFNEFRGLLRYVREWREVFEAVDQDHSSSIDPRELRKALYHFGYKLSSSLVGMIHDKYTSDAGEPDEDRGISFDRFLRACLGVERSQKAFKKGHHPDHRGRVRFNEEQFMIAALNSIEV